MTVEKNHYILSTSQKKLRKTTVETGKVFSLFVLQKKKNAKKADFYITVASLKHIIIGNFKKHASELNPYCTQPPSIFYTYTIKQKWNYPVLVIGPPIFYKM